MESIAAAVAPLANRAWFHCVEDAIEMFRLDLDGAEPSLELFARYVLVTDGLNLDDLDVNYHQVMRDVVEALRSAGVRVAKRVYSDGVEYDVSSADA